jgi:hypothetical protein
MPFPGVILGPPSSMKTVGIDMNRKSRDTYYTDNFSPNSFVSHVSGKSEEDLQKSDLLPKIKNKCLLTPELAPTFSAKEDDLHKFIGILTRVLDGHGWESDSGTHGHRGYSDRMMFTWIGTAVDIPFKVHKLMTTLGPKLYFIRIPRVQQKTDQQYYDQLFNSDFDSKQEAVQNALTDYQNWLELACPIMVADDRFRSNLKKMPWVRERTDENKDQFASQVIAFNHIIKLGKLLAHLRGVVQTWNNSEDTQGSQYGYGMPIIEEPDRAMQQLTNLAKGHALLTGRNYITTEEDLPMIIKVVLSTAPIERVTIFDILLANNGIPKLR